MSLIQWINFPVKSDSRGNLVAIEGGRTIPFDIKRIYYIYATHDKTPRGFHAHKSLLQVAVCVSGSCTMLLDNGIGRESIKLSDPGKGVFIGKMVWREMYDFSYDCTLLVMASNIYDEDDYIRSYTDFKNMVLHKNKS